MFKLSFNIPTAPEQISLEDDILLLGSCFSESIGAKLKAAKFRAQINPFGTIYNPASIFKNIRASLSEKKEIETWITQHKEIFYSWDAHSAISALDKNELVKLMNQTYQRTSLSLKSAKWLIITPGTAWVYELKESNKVVANCHKHPQDTFAKRLLSIDEISADFEQTYKILQAVNPGLKILFTVSPVRHIRDGLIENNISKSTLLLAVNSIIARHSDCFYFPSYEIMIDELRDYRFFKRDMIHPTEEAVDYIWQQFSDCYFDSRTNEFLKDWNKILQALNHKPFHPASKSHQDFLKATISKLERLLSSVDVNEELIFLKNQLKN